MQVSAIVLLLALELTAGYRDGVKWKLAYNIHPADGNDFGYSAKAWEDKSNVGTDENAFSADYKSYNATRETANSIAIVRHQNGECEAARVWKFLVPGKTLRDYLEESQTSRYIATNDYHSFSEVPTTMKHKDKDPIFAVDGAILFNWRYSDNGVRIGNSKALCSSQLPGADVNSDDFFGLGNDVGIRTGNIHAFDVDSYDCKAAYNKRAQGTDHGSVVKDGSWYGQYAVYVSDEVGRFTCDGVDLQVTVSHKSMVQFNHIDKGNDKFLNYEEVVFDIADKNNDRVLSFVEYNNARAMLGEVSTAAKVQSDFKRIDKDNDGKLSFIEIVFDTVDTNKDGVLSLVEYAEAYGQEKLGESDTDTNLVKNFERIDKDGDGVLNFMEIVFDGVDLDKDSEISKGEYSQANPDDSFEEN